MGNVPNSTVIFVPLIDTSFFTVALSVVNVSSASALVQIDFLPKFK